MPLLKEAIEEARSWFSRKDSGGPQPPRLSVMRIVEIPCPFCHQPLRDGDHVVSHDAAKDDPSGSREIAHARCIIVIRHPDGHLTTIDRLDDAYRALETVVRDPPKGCIILSPEEWLAWQSDGGWLSSSVRNIEKAYTLTPEALARIASGASTP